MENNSQKFKNISIAIFIVFLMAVIIYSLFWGPARKYTDSLMPAKTVTVSAEGKVTVSPDIAKFSFSVVSEGVDPKTIAEENIKQMNAAIDFVKSKGIEDKDIKTTSYDLQPRYEYDEKAKKTFISSYTLTQTVLVRVRDLNKVAEVLGGLPDLGINKIGSVSFEIDEPKKYLAEARDKAFEKAQEKAVEMASKTGVILGKVINFSEYGGGTPYYPYYHEKLGLGGAGEMAASVVPQIQPGTQEVTVNVSVTYEIRQ